MSGSCVRSIRPGSVLPNGDQVMSVSLECRPPAGASTYIVEEEYPAGWHVAYVSEGAKDVGGKLRWFFMDPSPRTLRYEVSPSKLLGGKAKFCGCMSSDGSKGYIESNIDDSSKP